MILEKVRTAINVTITYKNFMEVLSGLRKRKTPLRAIARNGNTIDAVNERQLWIIKKVAMGDSVLVGTDDSVEFSYKGRRLKFFGYSDNGDIEACFLAEIYEFLAPNDAIVVDIGANIGDSSVWFALNGAKKVLAIEPYPQNYLQLKRNVLQNHLQNVIEPMLSMIGSSTGKQVIDSSLEPSPYRRVYGARDGTSIQSYTLSDIVTTSSLTDALLKVDCEGCEYDALLCADMEIIRVFKRVIIEYHYGCSNLVRRLEDCGFSVEFTKPHSYMNVHDNGVQMMTGMIRANRID